MKTSPITIMNLEQNKIKTDSVQSLSNYLQKLFTENLLTAH